MSNTRRRAALRPAHVLGTVLVCTMSTAACQSQQAAVPQTALTATVDRSASGTDAFSSELRTGMADMRKAMGRAPMNGDPDHDFAAMMIPHHQGAVEMAEAELEHGQDSVLRRLAQEIVVTQQQEIDVMRRRMASTEAAAGAAGMAGMAGMRPGMAPVPEQPGQPTPSGTVAVSGHDRVYTADQTSNTVSVINPASNRLLGVIRLGDPVPAALSPLYKDQLLVHGMGFSPDHRTIAVVSVGSNSVTLIDTMTNKVKGVVYVGRSPHETFFTPDGKQLWATVRGQDYVSVIDPVAMKEIRRVKTANGPGMVLFSPDGQYAYVPSSFTPEVDVVDTRTYQVVARVPQASPFSPNLSVSRDGSEVWFTLKDSGKTQVMSGRPPFRILATLDTGPITNHVTLVDNTNGKFGYVTVGGENVVKAYRRGAVPKLVATIPTGDLPHGIWGSGDGTRVYVGLENQDAVAAIDTLTNKVIATIPIGQQPQQLVYVPDAVPSGQGTANLMPLGYAGQAGHISMGPPPGTGGAASATVSVNSLGALDLLEAAVVGLEPGKSYDLWLVDNRTAPFGRKEALGTFATNVAGAQVTQSIGLLRKTLAGTAEQRDRQRYLMISPAGKNTPVLVQTSP